MRRKPALGASRKILGVCLCVLDRPYHLLPSQRFIRRPIESPCGRTYSRLKAERRDRLSRIDSGGAPSTQVCRVMAGEHGTELLRNY
jgi:hypothetical protein